MNILGIDVGMSGALALYDGEELIIWDMPTNERNKTKRLDCNTLLSFINEFPVDHCFIEQVNAFGMGATSAYNFGFGCGVIDGLIVASKIPYTYVTPQKWKKAMSCPTDKDAARTRATQLFPTQAHQWPLKKHDGRAESAMIALYGYNFIK